MNTYKVFYQFDGKKFCRDVGADDKYSAEDMVKDLLSIHEVRLISGDEPECDAVDGQYFGDLFSRFTKSGIKGW